MPSRYFDLVSHWHLQAPRETVWQALCDTPRWPLWWRHVRRVQGEPRHRRIDWATPLGYGFTVDIELIEALPPERLRGRSSGRMQGEGIWLLRENGGHTDVTYVWRVTLAGGWLHWLAPLLAPLMRWNHAAVMRAGEAGLARHLAACAASAALTPTRSPGAQA